MPEPERTPKGETGDIHSPCRAAIYARVSTEDQSVATQVDSLVRRADDLGFVIPAREMYADVGVSGRLDSRPEFDRLRESIQSRAVDVLLVTKLDRIARSVRTALEFFDEAEAAGVRIIITEQAIDTATPAGRLTRTILAGVAEFEGELIRERTRAAMTAIRSGARKTRSGNPVGRPRRITSEITARVVELRGDGLRWADVARRVGLPAETCRKAAYLLKRSRGAVDNPRPSEIVRSTPEEPSR
ncbi:MAG: recombinase family protein [Thermoplasmata archaeon]|jgi:DNA invertase Pin-like site-specific DNA recombinase